MVFINCAGSYTVKNNTMNATAQVAKVPGFKSGQLFYRFKFEGEFLELTLYDEIFPDDTKPDWSGTWETEFKLLRAE